MPSAFKTGESVVALADGMAKYRLWVGTQTLARRDRRLERRSPLVTFYTNRWQISTARATSAQPVRA
ncbi:hypothetical protein QUB63_14775 [Microcoleus sp. ARI1-B5]|uniref:hypothetical protein n=1 Tax=unclassified Microcoleus TaxID=2642155 RepID=UPI002FD46E4B